MDGGPLLCRHSRERGRPLRLPAMGAFLVGWFFLSFLQIPADAVTLPRDVAGLQAFKAAMGNPPSLNSWNANDPCDAGWVGITCKTLEFASVVIEVHLNERYPPLAGQLPGPGSPFWNMTDISILDIMWNAVTGGLPEDVGNLQNLGLLLLNGNQLSGPLPRSLGKLQQINRIQIDENQFSGPVPAEIGNLPLFKHMHFNNNSLSGSIPASLGKLPKLMHLLLDNNNLSGLLPPELGNLSNLTIMQLDNNQGLTGSIPSSYGTMPHLRKMSMRNCRLNGSIPSLELLPELFYLDLSGNALLGVLPKKLGNKTTTINLSLNSFSGPIPDFYGTLPNLQAMYCERCELNGTLPPALGSVGYLSSSNESVMNLQNNHLTGNIPSGLANGVRSNLVALYLSGNPLCDSEGLEVPAPCASYASALQVSTEAAASVSTAGGCDCPNKLYPKAIPEALALQPQRCLCTSPLSIGMRLKSPSISVFQPYIDTMRQFLSQVLRVDLSQVAIGSYNWEVGPRLNFTALVFPKLDNSSLSGSGNKVQPLSKDEVHRIFETLYNWDIPDRDVFGPFEQRTIVEPLYAEDFPAKKGGSSLSAGFIVLIVLACVAGLAIFAAALLVLFTKITGRRLPLQRIRFYATHKGAVPWDVTMPKMSGCQVFSHEELRVACNGFKEENCVGSGGYGRVYKGKLPNGDEIAVKVPDQKSWQGTEEFHTEIELLSRVHHRNLVNLVGFSLEPSHEALVYEFVPGGTLKQHLAGKGASGSLPFLRRVMIALESAQAVHYLHTAASPPIIHRDLKTGNILLERHLHAKVADFGLSKKTLDPYEEGVTRKFPSPPKRIEQDKGKARAGQPLLPVRMTDSGEEKSGSSQSKQKSSELKSKQKSSELKSRSMTLSDTDHSTIKGTPGYVDPEYWATQELTAKSDVYSFGVVLAEIATGQTPMLAMHQLHRFFDKSEAIGSTMDPTMGSQHPEAMRSFLQLAFQSVQPRAEDRPTMADVIRRLESILQQLPHEEWETRAHKSLRDSANTATIESPSSFQTSNIPSLTSLSEITSASGLQGQMQPFYMHGHTNANANARTNSNVSGMELSSSSFEASGTREFAKVGDMSFQSIGPR